VAAASNAGPGMEREWERRDEDQRLEDQKMQIAGRMVGGVAHDFANLITLIGGYSEILLNRLAEGDPSRAELKEIRRAADRGAQLTSQLLGFTRARAIQPRPIDLGALVREVQGLLHPIIGEYIEVRLALAPNLDRVMADPCQIEQVVMNLILNARDAMPGGGAIRVETSDYEIDAETARQHSIPPGRYVAVSVGDTGHGIDSESMKRIFEPFFTTKEEGKGTGLGLSIVRDIVSANRGAVWAASVPGSGATFTVCLPRIRVAPMSPEGISAPASSAGASALPPEPAAETILLVEDEEPVRRLLAYILRHRGYKVLEAAGGDEALALFTQHGDSIHLLLTDMIMPKMNGRELCERLHAIRPGLKVVFMSGYTDDVLVRTGAMSPGMSFLQKPLRPDTLMAKVRAALDSPSEPFNPL
jgi:two-component system, cell cycle sensor histidine kinase and response regulator CckA